MRQLNILFALLFATYLASAQEVRLDSGLVAYYPFDGNTNDASGKLNHGIGHDIILSTGHCGNSNSAFFFNGTSSYIEVGDAISLRPVEMSIAAWVRLSSDGACVIMGKTQYSNSYYEQFSIPYNYYKVSGDTRSVGFHYGIKQPGYCIQPGHGWDVVYSKTQVPLNEWQFITATFGNSALSFYLNGSLVSSISSTYKVLADCIGGDLQIGRWWSGYPGFFNGSLDDIRIYNRALNEKEVMALYAKCEVITSVEDANIQENESGALAAYPNPNQSGVFLVNAITGDEIVKIYNVKGEMVKEMLFQKGNNVVDIGSFAKGLYCLKYNSSSLKLMFE